MNQIARGVRDHLNQVKVHLRTTKHGDTNTKATNFIHTPPRIVASSPTILETSTLQRFSA